MSRQTDPTPLLRPMTGWVSDRLLLTAARGNLGSVWRGQSSMVEASQIRYVLDSRVASGGANWRSRPATRWSPR